MAAVFPEKIGTLRENTLNSSKNNPFMTWVFSLDRIDEESDTGNLFFQNSSKMQHGPHFSFKKSKLRENT